MLGKGVPKWPVRKEDPMEVREWNPPEIRQGDWAIGCEKHSRFGAQTHESMSDEEKEGAFVDYMRKGYHHPSMTKVVEDKATLT